MMEKGSLNRLRLEGARVIATKVAREEMAPFVVGSEVLDESYLEAKYCWIFFKHPSIIIPKPIFRFVAFAVGYKGGSRLVYDLRKDPEKMQKHLSDLSEFFKSQENQ